MKKGLPDDGTEMFNAFEKGIEVRHKAYKKKNYWHRSRGLSSFKKELKEAISDGKDTDWMYNGEDEYQVNIFNEETAVKSVIALLKKKGLMKYIK